VRAQFFKKNFRHALGDEHVGEGHCAVVANFIAAQLEPGKPGHVAQNVQAVFKKNNNNYILRA
jgi:hypothetical protein